LCLAFALSLPYLLGEKQIKTKHPGRLFSRLPSLDLIDRAGWRLSVWGFVFLSIAIATGSLVSKESTGASFPLQPKEGFAVLAWALLAALIQARLVAGWRGRRVALLVVAGFLLLVGTYAGLFAAPPQSSTVSMLFPGGSAPRGGAQRRRRARAPLPGGGEPRFDGGRRGADPGPDQGGPRDREAAGRCRRPLRAADGEGAVGRQARSHRDADRARRRVGGERRRPARPQGARQPRGPYRPPRRSGRDGAARRTGAAPE